MVEQDLCIAGIIAALMVVAMLNANNISTGFLFIFYLCAAAVIAFLALRDRKIITVKSEQI
jgi:hypothetical protein